MPVGAVELSGAAHIAPVVAGGVVAPRVRHRVAACAVAPGLRKSSAQREAARMQHVACSAIWPEVFAWT